MISGDDSIFLDPRVLGNVVVVYGERPDKAFERDTDLRLVAEDLEKSGVNNLSEALALLPEIYVREAGRGGRQIDIRGARKGSVKVLIDGIAVSDPFYGNVDLSAVPITDIEQIRVSSAPASPIDGAGGSGGVIEVHTRDAYGDELLAARLQVDSTPSALASATARTMLGRRWAARLSSSTTYGSRDFELVMPDDRLALLDEAKRQSVGTARIEYRRGTRRMVTDLWMQHGSFVVPPAEDGGAMSILAVDGESQGRIGLSVDDRFGKWKLQARGHYHLLSRQSTYYDDPERRTAGRSEDLDARRTGAALVANRALGPSLHVVTAANVDSETADVLGFDGLRLGGAVTVLQAAGGVQLQKGIFKADAAAGLAAPIGLGADPWPELKLSLGARPAHAVELEITTGRKGRVPTLRERFRLDIGNLSLGPEQMLFGEALVKLRLGAAVSVQATSYLRRTNGLIRFDGDRQTLVNTDQMDIRGIELRLDSRVRQILTGVAYCFADAFSDGLGTESLDFFPKHRGDAYLTWRSDRTGSTARVRYIGQQIDRNLTLPATALLELSAFRELGRGLLASLRVDNLLDRRYEARAGVLAMGRTVFLSLQSEWQ